MFSREVVFCRQYVLHEHMLHELIVIAPLFLMSVATWPGLNSKCNLNSIGWVSEQLWMCLLRSPQRPSALCHILPWRVSCCLDRFLPLLAHGLFQEQGTVSCQHSAKASGGAAQPWCQNWQSMQMSISCYLCAHISLPRSIFSEAHKYQDTYVHFSLEQILKPGA